MYEERGTRADLESEQRVDYTIIVVGLRRSEARVPSQSGVYASLVNGRLGAF